MHKATIQGQADQCAAFVGREYSCNCTKAVCAVLKQSCLDQILDPNYTLQCWLICQPCYGTDWPHTTAFATARETVHCMRISIKAYNRLTGDFQRRGASAGAPV